MKETTTAPHQKLDTIVCVSAVAVVFIFQIWMTRPVVWWGLSHADDAILAHAAKSVAVGKGYGWARTPEEFSWFDPGAITTGPTLILPVALLIRVFGPVDQLPGAATLVIFLAQFLVAALVLSRHFGWAPACGFLALMLWLLMLASANNWFFGVFLGETVAFGFMLIGIALLAAFSNKQGTTAAALCFALAFLTKEICLFAIAGAVGAWFISSVCLQKERVMLLRRTAILVLVGITLPAAFEAVKLVKLGLVGYQYLWTHTSKVVALQAIGTGTWSDRAATFFSVFDQSYMSGRLLLGLTTGYLIGLALWWRNQGKGQRAAGRLSLFSWASAVIYFTYILVLSPIWQRHFWIGIALMLTAICAPVLSMGSKPRLIVIIVVGVSTLGLGLQRPLLVMHQWISTSTAPNERAAVAKLLDDHPELPYAAQGWSSIFDVVYLRREEGNWAYEPYTLNLRNKEFVALINDAFTLKNGPFFKSVVTTCEALTPQGRVNAFRCGERFWATYPVPSPNRSLSTTKSPGNPTTSFSGAIDRVDCQTVGGWVWKATDPEADLKVELYIDDKLVETQPARLVRPDLTGKLGTGRYGFSFTVPFAYQDAKPHSPSVRVVGSDFFVPFFAVVWPSFECGRQ